jgi:hypothetical protein
VEILIGEWLRSRRIQGKELVEKLEGRVSRNAVYGVLRGEGAQTATLSQIIDALQEMTGEKITPNDVFRFGKREA